MPQKPVQGGKTQSSENLAVLLFWPELVPRTQMIMTFPDQFCPL